MTTRQPDRLDPRRRRTADALLRVAEGMFAERPLSEVTVEELAERAGVAVGSLYNTFGSKGGLYAAVVERALDADRIAMDRAYLPDRSPVDQLYAAAEQYLDFYFSYPEYFRMLAFPGTPGHYEAGREVSDRLARTVTEQNDRLAAALQEAIDAGTLRAVDARQVATMLWAAWNGAISLAWRPDILRHDQRQLRELLATATDVVVHGLLLR